jgi:hypothetical protein
VRNRLRVSNAALTDAAEEINSGVIGADEVYGTVHGLGCDWETLMVVNVEGVSLASYYSFCLRRRSDSRVTSRL